jgi:phospholipase/carboxylesterase
MPIKETEQAVVLEPASAAVASVIWLHGLGADGHDFVPIVPELRLPETLAVRFVFPHAPVRPITINNGMSMRAWYDIPSLTRMDRQDTAGILDSESSVRGFLKRELDAGIPAERIVLAGFSQGGAIALHTGVRYDRRLAGIMGLSTYLPLVDRFAAEARPERRDTPLLMCHGTHDATLPMVLGSSSRDVLKAASYTVEWHEYPMQHQVCGEEIDDISRWLQERLM